MAQLNMDMVIWGDGLTLLQTHILRGPQYPFCMQWGTISALKDSGDPRH